MTGQECLLRHKMYYSGRSFLVLTLALPSHASWHKPKNTDYIRDCYH